jgi:hypothetical protein
MELKANYPNLQSRYLTFLRKVLLEAPYSPEKKLNNSVLLTIDLTKAVADEAIKRRDSIIIAYRTSHSSVNLSGDVQFTLGQC